MREEDDMSAILIVGGGKTGRYLAAFMLDAGHWVRLVEIDPHRVERLSATLPDDVLFLGSGTDPGVLERAGIHKADTVVAVTDRDETNLVVTSLARFEFGTARTVARVNNPKNAWMYGQAMGVDVAFDQADIIAHLIAEELSVGEMTVLLKLRRGRFALVEERIPPGAPSIGRTLSELDLPRHCVVVAILREGELRLPHGDTVLAPDDEVMALARDDTQEALARALGG